MNTKKEKPMMGKSSTNQNHLVKDSLYHRNRRKLPPYGKNLALKSAEWAKRGKPVFVFHRAMNDGDAHNIIKHWNLKGSLSVLMPLNQDALAYHWAVSGIGVIVWRTFDLPEDVFLERLALALIRDGAEPVVVADWHSNKIEAVLHQPNQGVYRGN